MKPNFALSLSFDGVAVYHRTSSGWLTLGTVSLEDPEMDERMGMLRRTAAELEPRGLSSKLIIPNSEILYREVPAPGPGQHSRELQVRQALDGMTPYPVEELAWDSRPAGDQARVAVVALETLAEAEAFAVKHRFNPVSFVAVPDGAWFEGEPFFGETKHAKTFLGRRDKLERDSTPVHSSGVVALPETDDPAQPVVPTTETEPVVTSPLRSGRTDPAAPTPAPAEATPAPKPAADSTAKPAEPAKKPAKGKSTGRGKSGQSLFDPRPPKPVTKPEAEPLAAAPTSAPGTTGTATKAPPVSASPAFSTRRPVGATAPDAIAARTLDTVEPRIGVPAARVDDGPAKPNGSYSNGHGTEFDEDPAQQSRLDALKSKFGFEMPKVKADALKAGMAPVLERTRALAKRAGDRTPKAETAADKEAEALTIFSQRGAEKQRGSARTGLLLTLVLVAVMVMVALGSLFLTDSGQSTPETVAALPDTGAPIEDAAGLPDTAALEPDRPEDVLLPDDTAEPGAEIASLPPLDSAEPEPPVAEDPVTEPVAETPVIDEPAATPAPAVRPAPQPLTPEMAEARYAATGIWQMAPNPIAPPTGEPLDDLYVASIDPVVTSEDAFAMPEVAPRDGDTVPAPQLAPAPFGTEFEFDDRGLVIATPDGALSPEGIPLFSGAPSVVPGPRPDDLAPQQDTQATVPDDLPRIRPPLRPTDLIEENERSRLGGRTRTELAALRPTLRPASLQTVAFETDDLDQTPTENAVALSRKPTLRPANFAAVVAATRRAAAEPATPAPPSDDAQGTAAIPASVAAARAPAAPVRADVARTATVSNAINLGRVNLIGVYGSSSDRRALVRLSSGRYVKVQVGDRVDGGQVAAIGSDELRYVKNGRNMTLTLPRG